MKSKLVAILWFFSLCCAQEVIDSEKLMIEKYKMQHQRNFPGQNKDVAVVIAISGGGHRAANFAMGVLMELEEYVTQENNSYNLLQQVDYFSTVSGGGFAAASYVSSLLYHIQDNHPVSQYSLKEAYLSGIYEDLAKNYQNIAKNISTKELLKITKNRWNRGDVLQRTIDDYLLKHEERQGRTLRLRDMFIDKTDSRDSFLPILIANGTVYENFAIFPFTPYTLEKYGITKYKHRFQLFDIQTQNNYSYDLPISVAIKASASFPLLISATTFTTKHTNHEEKPLFLHVLDGGIAENLGYKTALQILEKEPAEVKKVLIVIDAHRGKISTPFTPKESSPEEFDSWKHGMPRYIQKMVKSNIESKHQQVSQDLKRICTEQKITLLHLDLHIEIEDVEEAAEVATALKISPEEQSTLLKAAAKVVANHRDQLDKIVEILKSRE